MTPNERHAADARIQAAALRHYAQKCRDKAEGIKAGTDHPVIPETGAEWLLAQAERADQLANSYERLEIALQR